MLTWQYAGIALSTKGIGARFTNPALKQARQSIGLPLGNSYTLTGVPCDMVDDDVMNVLKQLQWSATIIPNSRRVRNRVATYRLRSEDEPPQTIVKLTCADEIITMQASAAAKREKQPKSDTLPAPTSWAEVAKRTLGTHSTLQPHTEQTGTGSARPCSQSKANRWGQFSTATLQMTSPGMPVPGTHIEQEDDELDEPSVHSEH